MDSDSDDDNGIALARVLAHRDELEVRMVDAALRDIEPILQILPGHAKHIPVEKILEDAGDIFEELVHTMSAHIVTSLLHPAAPTLLVAGSHAAQRPDPPLIPLGLQLEIPVHISFRDHMQDREGSTQLKLDLFTSVRHATRAVQTKARTARMRAGQNTGLDALHTVAIEAGVAALVVGCSWRAEVKPLSCTAMMMEAGLMHVEKAIREGNKRIRATLAAASAGRTAPQYGADLDPDSLLDIRAPPAAKPEHAPDPRVKCMLTLHMRGWRNVYAKARKASVEFIRGLGDEALNRFLDARHGMEVAAIHERTDGERYHLFEMDYDSIVGTINRARNARLHFEEQRRLQKAMEERVEQFERDRQGGYETRGDKPQKGAKKQRRILKIFKRRDGMVRAGSMMRDEEMS